MYSSVVFSRGTEFCNHHQYLILFLFLFSFIFKNIYLFDPWVRNLLDPLEEEMATHSSVLA